MYIVNFAHVTTLTVEFKNNCVGGRMQLASLAMDNVVCHVHEGLDISIASMAALLLARAVAVDAIAHRELVAVGAIMSTNDL